MKKQYQFLKRINKFKQSNKYIINFKENPNSKTILVLLGNREVPEVPLNATTLSKLKHIKKNQDLILDSLISFQNAKYIKSQNKLSIKLICTFIFLILSTILGISKCIIPTIILGLGTITLIFSTISTRKDCNNLEINIRNAFKDLMFFDKYNKIWKVESQNLKLEISQPKQIIREQPTLKTANEYEEKKTYRIKPIQNKRTRNEKLL